MRTLAEEVLAADRQKDQAEQDYADINTVTQENYFEIISETYLGQKQTNQFQDSEEDETIWWSLFQDDSGVRSAARVPNAEGSNATIGGISRIIANDANAEMPRSSFSGYNSIGAFYNYYAAVAESASYLGGKNPSDSLCPSGWGLPTKTGERSLRFLLYDKYQLMSEEGDNNNQANTSIRKLPFSILHGVRSQVGGAYTLPNAGRISYIISADGGRGTGVGLYGAYYNSLYSSMGLTKPSGFFARCNKK